jgi:hypothetical protein
MTLTYPRYTGSFSVLQEKGGFGRGVWEEFTEACAGYIGGLLYE